MIRNTYFQHKNINKYTRKRKSKGEKSIIDKMKMIKDTKVRIGPEIGSVDNKHLTKTKKPTRGLIRSYKLVNKIIGEQ